MLRIDRLTLAAERLVAMIEAVPAERLVASLPVADVPRVLRPFLPVAINWIRTTSLDSLRRLPALAAQAPAADAWLQHVIALVAWLDGQTDRMPPVLESASAPAIAWPSSAAREPERPPSSEP